MSPRLRFLSQTSLELQVSQAPPRADPSGELLPLSPMTTRTRVWIQVRPLGSDLLRVQDRDHRHLPTSTTTTSTSHQGPTPRPTLQPSCLRLQVRSFESRQQQEHGENMERTRREHGENMERTWREHGLHVVTTVYTTDCKFTIRFTNLHKDSATRQLCLFKSTRTQ